METDNKDELKRKTCCQIELLILCEAPGCPVEIFTPQVDYGFMAHCSLSDHDMVFLCCVNERGCFAD